jgi:hypothetical protein
MVIRLCLGPQTSWQSRGIWLVLALAVLSSQVTACSLLFSKEPPPLEERFGDFDCSGYTAPVLDTIWAGLNLIGAMSAAGTSQTDWDRTQHTASRGVTIGVGLAWFGISGVSAAYGYKMASACRDRTEEAADRPRRVPPRRPPPRRQPLPGQPGYVPAPANSEAPSPKADPFE